MMMVIMLLAEPIEKRTLFDRLDGTSDATFTLYKSIINRTFNMNLPIKNEFRPTQDNLNELIRCGLIQVD